MAVLAGLAAYVVYRSLPKTFVPGEDMGYLYIDCKMAEGTPMEATADVMKRIYRDVSSMPGVAKAVTLLGDSTLAVALVGGFSAYALAVFSWRS